MREKIKITLPEFIPAPEPPPFICDICDEERPHWWQRNTGKKKVCLNHTSPRKAMNADAYMSANWLDLRQVEAANDVITEIKYECSRRRKRPAN